MNDIALLDKEFERVRKELGFTATLEELDAIFFVRDFIARDKYVSTNLNRQLCHCIAGLFNNWAGYMHNIIMPPPGNMFYSAESSQFSEDERAQLIQTMHKFMAHVSKNTLIGLTKDKKEEAAFIDSSITFWNDNKHILISALTKTQTYWAEQGLKLPKKPKQEHYFH